MELPHDALPDGSGPGGVGDAGPACGGGHSLWPVGQSEPDAARPAATSSPDRAHPFRGGPPERSHVRAAGDAAASAGGAIVGRSRHSPCARDGDTTKVAAEQGAATPAATSVAG